MNIKKLLQAGEVVRYHNHSGIDKQTIAEHQWGVAMIVMYIDPYPSHELMRAALVHDCPEYHTGDLPAPVKWANAEIKSMLDALEDKWLQQQGMPIVLNAYDARILSLADKFEGMWYCIQQMKMGHQAARRPFREWHNVVRTMLESNIPTSQCEDMLNLLLTEKEKWDVSK